MIFIYSFNILLIVVFEIDFNLLSEQKAVSIKLQKLEFPSSWYKIAGNNYEAFEQVSEETGLIVLAKCLSLFFRICCSSMR
jgi:hypothetical protein